MAANFMQLPCLTVPSVMMGVIVGMPILHPAFSRRVAQSGQAFREGSIPG